MTGLALGSTLLCALAVGGAAGAGATPQVGIPTGGVFASTSMWRTDVRTAPVGEASAAQVTNLVGQVAAYYGGTAAFNNYQYGASWYNVDASTPRTTVLFSNCQRKATVPAGLYGVGGQFEQVPIPADAVPTSGTDSTIAVYDASTDTLWDFWKAFHDSAGWHACWGGRINNVSTGLDQFSGYFGTSASGLAYEGGVVSVHDVQSGSIDHAVALSLPRAALSKEVSWPATRGDGTGEPGSSLPQGSRLRLDPSLDVSTLGLTPIGAMVARAAQKYGFIVTDTAGCVSVPAESPAAFLQATGVDPWPALMGNRRPYQLLKAFPWDRLQVLPKDYGRP